jgi:hypothetical protein
LFARSSGRSSERFMLIIQTKAALHHGPGFPTARHPWRGGGVSKAPNKQFASARPWMVETKQSRHHMLLPKVRAPARRTRSTDQAFPLLLEKFRQRPKRRAEYARAAPGVVI